MKTYEKIYKLVKKIPRGKITTYGYIAQILDLDARVVGWALNRLARQRDQTSQLQQGSDPCSAVPWHRVINSKGGISTNRVLNIPLGLQRKLLEQEGIKFNKKENVELKKYIFGVTSYN